MSNCDRHCDVNDPSNYRPEPVHFVDCPVWHKIFHYTHDTVEDILR
jgi:hypothetical protein